MSDQTKREQQIADLREFVEFLEAHPDLPVGNNDIGSECIGADDDENGLARLHEIADILGVEVAGRPGGSYEAVRRFGTVAYRAFYVTRESMRQYHDDLKIISEHRRAVES